MSHDTEPPLSPALLEALGKAVEEGFGPISEAWGSAFVAQREFAERTEDKVDAALAKLLAIESKLDEVLRRLLAHERAPLGSAHPAANGSER